MWTYCQAIGNRFIVRFNVCAVESHRIALSKGRITDVGRKCREDDTPALSSARDTSPNQKPTGAAARRASSTAPQRPPCVRRISSRTGLKASMWAQCRLSGRKMSRRIEWVRQWEVVGARDGLTAGHRLPHLLLRPPRWPSSRAPPSGSGALRFPLPSREYVGIASPPGARSQRTR
jgi:hypothetical protein